MAGRKNQEQKEKERQEELHFIANISSVKDIIEWKKRKYMSVEEYNKDIINKLGWIKSDVLYSFLSIYVIGMFAYYPDKYYRTGITIKCKQSRSKVYSNLYVKRNYDNCKELNDFLEKIGFVKHYFDIGNVIPIWPGGNTDRGTRYMYDLPELYFGLDENFIWKNVLSEVYKNSFMDEIFNPNWMCKGDIEYINEPAIFSIKSTEEFLDSLVADYYPKGARIGLYQMFVQRIIGIIEKRTQNIKKIL